MNFLESHIQELKKAKAGVEKAIAQVSDSELHWEPAPDANSIAILVKHIAGNMVSRWTDFLTTDGEKPNRQRDGEFIDDVATREQLMSVWDRGWTCLLDSMGKLTDADMQKTVYIRQEAHSVPLAIVRQTMHYSLHFGQIVYIAKQIRGAEWKSLSIPKGKSAEYNAAAAVSNGLKARGA